MDPKVNAYQRPENTFYPPEKLTEPNKDNHEVMLAKYLNELLKTQNDRPALTLPHNITSPPEKLNANRQIKEQPEKALYSKVTKRSKESINKSSKSDKNKKDTSKRRQKSAKGSGTKSKDKNRSKKQSTENPKSLQINNIPDNSHKNFDEKHEDKLAETRDQNPQQESTEILSLQDMPDLSVAAEITSEKYSQNADDGNILNDSPRENDLPEKSSKPNKTINNDENVLAKTNESGNKDFPNQCNEPTKGHVTDDFGEPEGLINCNQGNNEELSELYEPTENGFSLFHNEQDDVLCRNDEPSDKSLQAQNDTHGDNNNPEEKTRVDGMPNHISKSNDDRQTRENNKTESSENDIGPSKNKLTAKCVDDNNEPDKSNDDTLNKEELPENNAVAEDNAKKQIPIGKHDISRIGNDFDDNTDQNNSTSDKEPIDECAFCDDVVLPTLNDNLEDNPWNDDASNQENSTIHQQNNHDDVQETDHDHVGTVQEKPHETNTSDEIDNCSNQNLSAESDTGEEEKPSQDLNESDSENAHSKNLPIQKDSDRNNDAYIDHTFDRINLDENCVETNESDTSDNSHDMHENTENNSNDLYIEPNNGDKTSEDDDAGKDFSLHESYFSPAETTFENDNEPDDVSSYEENTPEKDNDLRENALSGKHDAYDGHGDPEYEVPSNTDNTSPEESDPENDDQPTKHDIPQTKNDREDNSQPSNEYTAQDSDLEDNDGTKKNIQPTDDNSSATTNDFNQPNEDVASNDLPNVNEGKSDEHSLEQKPPKIDNALIEEPVDDNLPEAKNPEEQPNQANDATDDVSLDEFDHPSNSTSSEENNQKKSNNANEEPAEVKDDSASDENDDPVQFSGDEVSSE